VTYTTQAGSYNRIGKIVVLSGRLAVNSLGTLGTGEGATIGGLPFNSTSSPASIAFGGSIGAGASLAIPAGEALSLRLGPNSNAILINKWDLATGTSQLSVAEYSAGGLIDFTITYFVN